MHEKVGKPDAKKHIWEDIIVTYLPQAGAVETQKPRNTNAAVVGGVSSEPSSGGPWRAAPRPGPRVARRHCKC
jgi:hypothetical protein